MRKDLIKKTFIPENYCETIKKSKSKYFDSKKKSLFS